MDDIKTYVFYKSENPNNIIMIRIGDFYCSWLDDYDIVGNADNWQGEANSPEYKFHFTRLSDVLHNIRQPVTFVEFRNKSGDFSLPDIDQLLKESREDY